MKLEAKCNFHNRFDIEVRDKDTGELKQKGMAENIVLDRAYTRVCNFQSYFTNIHFGKGTGTLSPSRTTLFSSLGYKTATVDETIREYPISRVTKRIRLEPQEYVGQTITEVGISEATNAINTHALIKDAEGNPLSIVKTELDVVIIYATVYVEFQDSGGFAFSKIPESSLISYFMTNASVSKTLSLGADSGETYRNGIGWQESTATLTRTADVAARKAVWSIRLGVDSNNWDIRELELQNICRVDLENSPAWTPFRLEGVAIGVGNGETTAFDLGRYGTSDIAVKVDGNIVSNYVITNNAADNRAYYPLHRINTNPDPDVVTQLDSDCCRNVYRTSAPHFNAVLHVDPDKAEGAQIEATIRGGKDRVYEPMRLYVQGSYDNENYTTIGDIYSSGFNKTVTDSVIINAPYPYLKIYDTGSSDWDAKGQIVQIRWISAELAPQIVFDTAPIEGVEITADYTVPYIPKTSDYVLDITFELTFGEGV